MNRRLEILRRRQEDIDPDRNADIPPAKILRRKIKTLAPVLHRQIETLFQFIGKDGSLGKLDLIADLDRLREILPKRLADCFLPEFEFQPDEITFSLSARREPTDGTHYIKFELRRNNKSWSEVSAGAFVSPDDIGGSSHITCQAPQGQVQAARFGMERLRRELTQWDLTSGADAEVQYLVPSLNNLHLAEEMLNVAVTSIENRLGVPTS